MRTEIPYDFMPPEQHFNNPEALLRAIEGFQETRILVDGDERFNPPPGKFEKLLKEDGGYVLCQQPGIMHSCSVVRVDSIILVCLLFFGKSGIRIIFLWSTCVSWSLS